MANIVTLRLIITWRTIIINNPYIIAILFLQFLILLSCLFASVRRFIALVLFLIYVGGIMILIRYCVILIPFRKFSGTQLEVFSLSMTASALLNLYLFLPINSYPYSLLFTSSTLLLIVLLLYLVLLAVVDITDYASGSIKM